MIDRGLNKTELLTGELKAKSYDKIEFSELNDSKNYPMIPFGIYAFMLRGRTMISETHEQLGDLVAAVYRKVDWKKQTSLKEVQ